ncbi:MAG: hypothetical protein WAK48_31930 [Candidatus Acidiferrum sp.]
MRDQPILGTDPNTWDGLDLKPVGRWFRRGDLIIVTMDGQWPLTSKENPEQWAEVAETASGGLVAPLTQIASALRRGSWPLAIQLAITNQKRDENYLTDMVFYARHPERHGQRLQPNERASIQEWLGIRDRLVRPALRATPAAPVQTVRSASLKPAWVQTILPLLNRYRGDIPLDFLLGWIAVESGGRIGDVTNINERGYFQIHPDESKTLGIEHDRLSTDPDYSVKAGIQLVKYDAKWALSLGLPYGSDLFWHVVKMRHWLPAGVNAIVRDMRLHGAIPNSWDEFRAYAVANRLRIIALIKKATGGRWGPKWDPQYGVNVVDRMFNLGRQLTSGLGRS